MAKNIALGFGKKKRRLLDASQRSWVAAKIANMQQRERTDLEPSANLQKDSIDYYRQELHRIINENYNPTTAHLPPKTAFKNIANAVTNSYAERSRKQCLTGDWIIYAQHEGQNYYLCLSAHGKDADAFERIKRCCVDEFPFLRSQLNLIE
jgi:hypothetical protein